MSVFHGDKNLVLGRAISQWDHDLGKYVLDLDGKVAAAFRKVCEQYTYAEVDPPKQDSK